MEFPSKFLFFLKLRGLPGNAGNTVADYYGCAPVLQWLCFRFAITMLLHCNNYVIDFNPNRSLVLSFFCG